MSMNQYIPATMLEPQKHEQPKTSPFRFTWHNTREGDAVFFQWRSKHTWLEGVVVARERETVKIQVPGHKHLHTAKYEYLRTRPDPELEK